MSSFSTLLPSLVASLKSQGIRVPTEVQASTLGPQLAGRSVIAVAETGSGKTLAYVLPLLHRLKTLENDGDAVREGGRPRGLILVPGRELGEQVSRVLKGLTHLTRLRVRVALGGSPLRVARRNVAGAHEVLVATPGRLVQLLDAGELRLSDLRTLVLDEADQMLDPGFQPVARRIVDTAPSQLQVAMFSATLSHALESVGEQLFPKPPLKVRTRGSSKLVPTLKVDNRPVGEKTRLDGLGRVLAEDLSLSTLLFCNSRQQCEAIAKWLDEHGLPFVNYRGEMNRSERRSNLRRFREGEVKLMLTTDLGGRGLDIEHVERVINVHMPKDLTNYLHRAGRTARAGRSGVVVNLVTERDQRLLAKLEKRGLRN